MILYAHRGNTHGPNPDMENKPSYIETAIASGYHVEVDVRGYSADELYLGHDYNEYKIHIDFLHNPKIICHAKTIRTLQILLENNIHCFFHNSDQCTLTSNNIIWTYPGRELTDNSICVMPERGDAKFVHIQDINCYGICSDRVSELSTILCGIKTDSR